jgi:hypothetical protein
VKKSIPEPDNISITTRGSHTIIVRKWSSSIIQKLFLTFFCIAWDSFLVFWYSMAFSDINAPWIMKVFPIGHVAVGIGLTYYVLTLYLNKTIITLTSSTLQIAHTPIYWPGNKKIDRSELSCLYVTKSNFGNNRNTQRSYSMFYIDQRNKKQKFLNNISDPQEALYLLKVLEDTLGIAHIEVAGEYVG